MATERLTKTVVDRLATSGIEQVIWDSELPGFGVRIKPSGVRSYVVQYRHRESGTSRRKTIGQHGPLLTFHAAKERARIILAEALKGNDPVDAEKKARAAQTVRELAADYLTHHALPKKRPRCVADDRSVLDRVVLPKLGAKKVKDVQHKDISAIHTALRATPYQANRVMALLSKMFSLAVQWGWRPDNPVKGIQRYREEHRERWLSEAELGRLLAVLAEHPNQRAANAIRLQLLTGARIGEVLAAEWTEIDLQRGVWTKPSHHTKQKRTEHLPLSGAALTMLAAMRERAGKDDVFIFSGDAPGKPLQGIKKFWARVVTKARISDYRIHDNRHTHASHLVSSGLSLEIVGRLLGHTNPTTTKRYAHLADSPLRAAAERFGNQMTSIEQKFGT